MTTCVVCWVWRTAMIRRRTPSPGKSLSSHSAASAIRFACANQCCGRWVGDQENHRHGPAQECRRSVASGTETLRWPASAKVCPVLMPQSAALYLCGTSRVECPQIDKRWCFGGGPLRFLIAALALALMMASAKAQVGGGGLGGQGNQMGTASQLGSHASQAGHQADDKNGDQKAKANDKAYNWRCATCRTSSTTPGTVSVNA